MEDYEYSKLDALNAQTAYNNWKSNYDYKKYGTDINDVEDYDKSLGDFADDYDTLKEKAKSHLKKSIKAAKSQGFPEIEEKLNAILANIAYLEDDDLKIIATKKLGGKTIGRIAEPFMFLYKKNKDEKEPSKKEAEKEPKSGMIKPGSKQETLFNFCYNKLNQMEEDKEKQKNVNKQDYIIYKTIKSNINSFTDTQAERLIMFKNDTKELNNILIEISKAHPNKIKFEKGENFIIKSNIVDLDKDTDKKINAKDLWDEVEKIAEDEAKKEENSTERDLIEQFFKEQKNQLKIAKLIRTRKYLENFVEFYLSDYNAKVHNANKPASNSKVKKPAKLTLSKLKELKQLYGNARKVNGGDTLRGWYDKLEKSIDSMIESKNRKFIFREVKALLGTMPKTPYTYKEAEEELNKMGSAYEKKTAEDLETNEKQTKIAEEIFLSLIDFIKFIKGTNDKGTSTRGKITEGEFNTKKKKVLNAINKLSGITSYRHRLNDFDKEGTSKDNTNSGNVGAANNGTHPAQKKVAINIKNITKEDYSDFLDYSNLYFEAINTKDKDDIDEFDKKSRSNPFVDVAWEIYNIVNNVKWKDLEYSKPEFVDSICNEINKNVSIEELQSEKYNNKELADKLTPYINSIARITTNHGNIDVRSRVNNKKHNAEVSDFVEFINKEADKEQAKTFIQVAVGKMDIDDLSPKEEEEYEKILDAYEKYEKPNEKKVVHPVNNVDNGKLYVFDSDAYSTANLHKEVEPEWKTTAPHNLTPKEEKVFEKWQSYKDYLKVFPSEYKDKEYLKKLPPKERESAEKTIKKLNALKLTPEEEEILKNIPKEDEITMSSGNKDLLSKEEIKKAIDLANSNTAQNKGTAETIRVGGENVRSTNKQKESTNKLVAAANKYLNIHGDKYINKKVLLSLVYSIVENDQKLRIYNVGNLSGTLNDTNVIIIPKGIKYNGNNPDISLIIRKTNTLNNDIPEGIVFFAPAVTFKGKTNIHKSIDSATQNLLDRKGVTLDEVLIQSNDSSLNKRAQDAALEKVKEYLESNKDSTVKEELDIYFGY